MRSGIRVRFVTIFAAAIVTAIAPVTAQQQQQQQPAPAPTPSPSPSPSPNVPGPGRPGTSPFPGDRTQQPTDRTPPFQQEARPVFLSGKVMLQDGTPPPEPVMVERVCNGIARPEAYTDSKGRFSFQLGQRNAMLADASVSDAGIDGPGGFGGQRNMGGFGNTRGGMMGEQQLMGCELRAVLPGFRSEIVNLAGRRSLDNPDVGTIILRRMGNVEGTTISATSLQAPKDAKKAYEKGLSAMKKKKVEDARKEFQKAVDAYPKYAAAWHELGVTHEIGDNVAEARKCYAASLEADSKYVKPYLQLANLAAREKNWKEVAETTDRVIRLDPFDYPQAYLFNSVANYNLGKIDAAEKSAREAQKLDTYHRFPKADHLLGIILADRRDFNGAAEQMRNYLKFAPNAQDAGAVRNQLTEIEKLAQTPKQ